MGASVRLLLFAPWRGLLVQLGSAFSFFRETTMLFRILLITIPLIAPVAGQSKTQSPNLRISTFMPNFAG